MKFFHHFGDYLFLLRDAFGKPDNYRISFKRIMQEMNVIGVGSLGIVIIISLFMGMVLTLEIAYQLVASWIADTVIGEIISDTTMLELAPSITALVLAGRVGSNIAAEIGNMKISEQIDALHVMGVNAPSYLIMPKIVAAVIVIPMLIIISIALSLVGGMFIGHVTGICSLNDFVAGAQQTFKVFTLVFAVIKAFTFAFVISTISSYHGYKVTGGALEVGKASTRAVVQGLILIVIFDYLLAQTLL
ncbi:MlaE family ABC transporter permease [Bacteroidota bacterium]